jgi:predicted acylesterase/phospholipase RssA
VSAPAYTEDFEQVRAAEAEWLAARRAAVGMPPPNEDIVGLAFSGGGIRSAIFNLGVLQGLQAAGLLKRVDYLSSVSGGGYVSSCLSWLKQSRDKDTQGALFGAPLEGHGGTVLDWLRAHGKYLVAHRGFSIWTLLASIFASTFANVFVLGPALLFCVWALTLAWLPLSFPAWLSIPGLPMPHTHHGFWLLLLAGFLCFAVFPFVALGFTLFAGLPKAASVQRVDAWRVFMGRLLVFGIAFVALGLIPVVGMLGEWAQRHFDSPHAHRIGFHTAWLSPILSGLGSMLADKLKGGAGRGRLATIGVALVVYGLLVGLYLVATDREIVRTTGFIACAALSVLLAFVCNINRVSIHSYYRARLACSFLPPIFGRPVRDGGELKLDALQPGEGAPLHLINCTLNTSTSDNERDRARLGASFGFSALYSGSQQTGWRRVSDYAGGSLTLSTAFTISGAAIDPDTYATNARPIAFLMGLLNVRLGYWAKNPRLGDQRNPLLPWWWIFLFREMLGIRLDARRRHIHLSDGGGFENLAIYELVRRRVKTIVVCDAGADPDLTLSDLGRAIERVRADFGAEISLAADQVWAQRSDVMHQTPWLRGTVRYADGSEGRILYIKPMLCAGLTADIYAYWRANPSFPDEPTSEQFFAEPQFEAYRALGEQIVARLASEFPAVMPGGG